MVLSLAIALNLLISGQNAPNPIPLGFGVNTHFTQPAPGEMARLKQLGVQYIRTDLAWTATEPQKGIYNFLAYDALVNELNKIGVKPLFILDYSHPFYQADAPTTEPALAAFEKWAKAAVTRYKGKGVVWEIWNEPNLAQFWKPQPDPKAYAKLALRTAKAIRAADPNAVIQAPGISGFDFKFLETTFQAGLLNFIDGVSIHPYRQGPPESATADINKLRGMIQFFSPNRDLPIISSEWGYSTAWNGFSNEKQAAYLVRSWATALANGVPISIFYDWKDDGPDPKNAEHRFGILTETLEPKPAFTAAKDFLEILDYYDFTANLTPKNSPNWRILFTLKSSNPATRTREDFLELTWNAATDQIPSKQPLGPDLTLAQASTLAKAPKTYEATPYRPNVQALGTEWNGAPAIVIDNQSGVTGTTKITGVDKTQPFESEAQYVIPSPAKSQVDFKLSSEIPGWIQTLTTALLDPKTEWIIDTYANDEIRNTAKTTPATQPEFRQAATAQYNFKPGWEYMCIKPTQKLEIPKGATSAAVWIKAAHTDNYFRSRFQDSQGRFFQVDLPNPTRKAGKNGWTLVNIPLNGDNVGISWRGDPNANFDGIPKGQLTWNTLILIDSARRESHQSGEITFGPIYYQFKS